MFPMLSRLFIKGDNGWVVLAHKTISVPLSKNKKNITIFHLKIIFFTAVKICSILHRHVFVMEMTQSTTQQVFNMISLKVIEKQ